MTRRSLTPLLLAFCRKKRNNLIWTVKFSMLAENTVFIIMVWSTRIWGILYRVYLNRRSSQDSQISLQSNFIFWFLQC